jgi:hypothetical protein
VEFDMRVHERIQGLRVGGMRTLKIADPFVQGEILALAGAVWHLRERLDKWGEATGATISVRREARRDPNLCLCADLWNAKKHGECRDDLSGLHPRLDTVEYDLSRSGSVELACDGASQVKEVIVAAPVPIPFRVNLLTGDGVVIGNVVDIIRAGMLSLLPAIRQLGVLNGEDRPAVELRRALGL